jgi:hypothetical protein
MRRSKNRWTRIIAIIIALLVVLSMILTIVGPLFSR